MARQDAGMAHSFLVFDFGGDETTAQHARQRIAGWKQGFRLDKKLEVKFERAEPRANADGDSSPETKSQEESPAKAKNKPGSKSKAGKDAASDPDSAPSDSAHIRLIVRLDFSDHEKLSHQRWIERIPAEEPFKSASPKVVRAGEPEFKSTSDLFDSLD